MRGIRVRIGIGIAVLVIFSSIVYVIYAAVSLNGRVLAAYESAYQESYEQSYENGYEEGYEEQYPAGYDEGYESGLADGHTRGYDEGYEGGLADGRDQGYDLGYESGMAEGRKRGYDEGYASGMAVGRERGYGEGYPTGVEAGHSDGLATQVDLSNPTYMELLNFLSRDRTDTKPYIVGDYVCTDFSTDVNNNAEVEGIRCAFVHIDYADEDTLGHAIVAFETTDRGLVFIEPQSDSIVNAAIGKRWYLCIVLEPGYFYLPPDYDDTIVEIEIIW
jgi:hypothetical protein